MDIPASFVNALIRKGPGTPVRLEQEDIEIHRTRNTPKCATCVLMDMSGSMRYDGQYINVKRMALALEGLIRSEYPGDYLQFIEMYTFAKPVPRGKLDRADAQAGDDLRSRRAAAGRHEPRRRQRAPDPAALHEHPARPVDSPGGCSSTQDTPNRQIILITDGLPTAHFEGADALPALPARPADRGGDACAKASSAAARGSRSTCSCCRVGRKREEDVRFAYRLAESTKGRVFFTAGRDLDRYVVWDYLSRRREIVS